MSSLQSLREFISERLAAAAEEIFRHCEGTIVQYEQELCRQRRLLEIAGGEQHFQLNSIVLPQRHVEVEDFKNKLENFRVEHEEPETPRIKGEPEPPQIKEEQEGLCIFQVEEQLGLKQEADNFIVTGDENERNIADLDNLQRFNAVYDQDEEENGHEESTSTAEIRDQRMDQNYVHNLDSSQISDSQCESDVRKGLQEASWVQKCKQSQIENRLSYIKYSEPSEVFNNLCVKTNTAYNKRPHVCQECGRRFSYFSRLKAHMTTHSGEKPFCCELCDKCFNNTFYLKRHMRTHTGEKSFSCKACDKRFCIKSDLKRHMATHTGEKPFSCKECDKRFSQLSNLKRHMGTHAREKTFL